MISVDARVIGGEAVAAMLKERSGLVRSNIVAKLDALGQRMLSVARSLAPVRTGGLRDRIVYYFGRRGSYRVKGQKGRKAVQVRDTQWKDGRIEFGFQPTGRVAHLMERGVSKTFYQRPGNRGGFRRGHREVGPYGGEAMQGPEYRYERTLKIAARPFFQPAVDSVGGPAGINAALQEAVNAAAIGKAA